MTKRELNYWVNVMLFVWGVVVMATGLVLFFEFHVGHGSSATEFAALSKAWWRNIHRSGAAIFFPAMAVHLWLHWACVRATMRGFRKAAPPVIRHRLRHQGTFLVLAAIVGVTGFVAWFLFPYYVDTLHETRHAWIDVHDIAGLALFVGSAVHVGHRWKRLWGG